MKEYKPDFTLLTFYKFIDVDSPQEEVYRQYWFCKDLGLKGRVFLGEEGISATVSGTPGQLWSYRKYLEDTPWFKNIPDIDIKASKISSHAFDKMIVRYRKEIVSLGKTYTAAEIERHAKKISIDQFKKIIDDQQFDDYAILDMRNSYEYKLGHFKGAVPSGTVNFKELEQVVKNYKIQFGDKKIIMYCTGGIRCEKASVMLNEFGLDRVYQLDGGVVKYVHTFNDGNWLGNLYTFDGLVSTQIGDEITHMTIGSCLYTGLPTNEVANCRYGPCNARIICRTKQYKRHGGFCSKECFDHAKQDMLIRNVSFDSFDYNDLRSYLKKNPSEKNLLLDRVRDHLEKNVKVKYFPHSTSQKEDLIEE